MAQTGKFVWYDLNALDVDAAERFYGEVVGWKTQEWGDKEGLPHYKMLMVGERAIGGITLLAEQAKAMGAPPHWLAYVSVEDVDATLVQVAELGGTVYVPATDIPEVGRFGIFADPTGAVLAAFKSANDSPGREGDPQPGDITWNELMSTDPEASWTFYSTLFGWTVVSTMESPMGPYHMYGQGEDMYGGYMKAPDGAPSHWLYYAKVQGSAQAACDRITKAGGEVLMGPMEVPDGTFVAACKDAQGAAFAINADT